MRLFIAIDFNEIKDYLIELQNKIDSDFATFKKPSSFHLTLKFLGETSKEKLGIIEQRLHNIDFEHFCLTSDNIGIFKKQGNIKIIWVGLKEEPLLIKLQKNIQDALYDFGIKQDNFHPHITLARVRMVKDNKKLEESLLNIEIPKKTIKIDKFKLVESKLTEKGPIYDDLFIFQ